MIFCRTSTDDGDTLFNLSMLSAITTRKVGKEWEVSVDLSGGHSYTSRHETKDKADAYVKEFVDVIELVGRGPHA